MTSQVETAVRADTPAYQRVIDDICNLKWTTLTEDDLIGVAWIYYYFSVQFRECLEAARVLYPNDELLVELDQGERNTDNLSPWPGVAAVGEKLNHDEFMRRSLELTKISENRRRELQGIGESYLMETRKLDSPIKALALASYEDGGLERIFEAILTAPHWRNPLLLAFNHFLTEHIKFDSDPTHGHGALCRHLSPDDRILSLWSAFRHTLIAAAPRLKLS